MLEKVNINISARHVHLTQEDLDILIGHELTVRNELNQVGQFAANETVDIVTENGRFENVRIVGPVRSYTQVEVSKSDARVLGIDPPVRKSGDLIGAEEVTIKTSRGKVFKKCAIIANRHVHFSLYDAIKYKVSDGEILNLEIGGIKRGVIQVEAKVSEDGFFEAHLDTDDANAFLLNKDSIGILTKKD